MTSWDTEEGWTLHTTRAGTRNPSATPGTQNPYDTLRVNDEHIDSPPQPEPVRTPHTNAPTPNTGPTPGPSTSVDITTIKYIKEVDYSFLDRTNGQ